ncbi:MAG: LuxR C-terminal-related transcriptional regulator [Acidobacteria bacterium]|nr:LuxR C-terminal-related transcriptional regulator [Acidobacteriota bacterium]
MARKTPRGKSGKGAQGAAENVHRMPSSGRRRTTPAEDPLAFPNVPTIVTNASRAAVAVSSDNVIEHWNDAAIELFGFTADEAIGRNLQTVIQARDVFGNRLANDHGAFHEMVRIGESPQSFELAIITATGKMIRVAVSVVVVLGPQPAEYSLIYLMTPMHRRRRADEAIDRILAQVNLPGVTTPGAPIATGANQRGTIKKPHLTRRQLEVLLLLAEGKRSSEIAAELNISVHTVRTHIQGILRTLGAANRLEAVSRALHERII